MSEKQRLLDAFAGLPDSLNWSRVKDAVLNYLAVHGTPAEYAQFYHSQLTAEDLAEYENPKTDHELGAVIAEIRAMHEKREPA